MEEEEEEEEEGGREGFVGVERQGQSAQAPQSCCSTDGMAETWGTGGQNDVFSCLGESED